MSASFRFTGIVLGIGLLPWLACGDTISVKNGSFEQPELPREGKQAKPELQGWKTTGAAGVFVNNGSFGKKMEGADGEQMAYVNGTQASSIAQDVADQFLPSTTYRFKAAVGLRKDTPLSRGSSLILRLQAVNTVSRSVAVHEITVGQSKLSDESLQEFTLEYTTGKNPPSGTVHIAVSVGEKDGDGSGDWTIDNVRLETLPSSPQSVAATKSHVKASSAKTVYYNRDIRPILSENCFACHGPDSASRKADLRLDRYDDAIASRKGSAAIVPGNPSRSELVARISTVDADDIMPPLKSHKKLSPEQIKLLTTWVSEGAEYEAHWAFIPPKRPSLPRVKDEAWVRNPIDRFVLARLETEGLRPASAADARTLARRLSLDLTGLPPSPAEVQSFVTDKSSDADKRFVRKLLNSKDWGEHRARYWLDAARYADTHGIHFDNFREMWSYRDWVINAFNRNLPFDRFTTEQLAGDLLPNRTLEQQIASGFNRSHITSNEGGLIDEEYLVLYTRDRTETASAVWMGMTANCATCHDHKFDPLSQREFYELSAFFNNSTIPAKDGNRRDPPPVVVVPRVEDRDRWTALAGEVSQAKEKLQARRNTARPDYTNWVASADPKQFQDIVPGDSLLLHAALTEGQGNKVTFSASGDLRSTTSPKDLTWGSGQIGARSFKAMKDAALELGDYGDFDHQDKFSYGAWIKPTDRETMGGVIARMDEANKYRGWDLFYDKGRVAVHLVHDWPDDAIKVTAKGSLEAGRWTHVFVTYDGSAKPQGVKIYLNGKPAELDVDRKTLKNTLKSAAPLTVGRRHPSAKLDKVSIQDVRIYGTELKRSDVEGLVNGTRGGWLVSKPADQRTKEEDIELFDRWLTQVDEPFQALARRLARLEKEEADIKQRGTVAHVMEERPREPMAHVLHRGEYDKRRDLVVANTPAILPPMSDDLPRNRIGLAQWLLLPEHPLTARVTVNRFWQELFGTGLVRTSGDFGVSGELPSHPELLDWLAVEFRESGWDVKKLFELIVNSATYRQSAQATAEKLQKDPQNRLFSRGPRFRMDAEMVRDYALAASGLLVDKVGGPSVKPYQPEGVWEAVAMPESNTKKYERDSGDKLYRRSLYTFWKRSAPPASMDIFNAPNRETCTVRRERTNTPLQALVTLNDPQFIEAARHLAGRAIKASNKGSHRLDFIAQQLLARSLRPDEKQVTEDVLEDLEAHYRAHPADVEALLSVGESKCEPSPELAAYTMVVNQLMNLDEVLNK